MSFPSTNALWFATHFLLLFSAPPLSLPLSQPHTHPTPSLSADAAAAAAPAPAPAVRVMRTVFSSSMYPFFCFSFCDNDDVHGSGCSMANS